MADTTATVENVGNLKDVLDFISVHRSVIDLKRIYNAAWDRVEAVEFEQASETNWRVGMPVQQKQEHHNRRPHDAIGHVIKVNLKTVIVSFPNWERVKCPKTMLNEVSEPNAG